MSVCYTFCHELPLEALEVLLLRYAYWLNYHSRHSNNWTRAMAPVKLLLFAFEFNQSSWVVSLHSLGVLYPEQIDGLLQDYCKSRALAMELQ